MANRWTIDIKGRKAVIDVRGSVGTPKIYVNNRQINVDKKIHPSGRMYYEIVLAGEAIGIQGTANQGVYRLIRDPQVELAKKNTVREEFDIPWWAWIFIVLNGAIGVLGFCAMIPMGISLAGVWGIRDISKREDISEEIRILICSGITLLAWGAFIGLIAAIFFVLPQTFN